MFDPSIIIVPMELRLHRPGRRFPNQLYEVLADWNISIRVGGECWHTKNFEGAMQFQTRRNCKDNSLYTIPLDKTVHIHDEKNRRVDTIIINMVTAMYVACTSYEDNKESNAKYRSCKKCENCRWIPSEDIDGKSWEQTVIEGPQEPRIWCMAKNRFIDDAPLRHWTHKWSQSADIVRTPYGRTYEANRSDAVVECHAIRAWRMDRHLIQQQVFEALEEAEMDEDEKYTGDQYARNRKVLANYSAAGIGMTILKPEEQMVIPYFGDDWSKRLEEAVERYKQAVCDLNPDEEEIYAAEMEIYRIEEIINDIQVDDSIATDAQAAKLKEDKRQKLEKARAILLDEKSSAEDKVNAERAISENQAALVPWFKKHYSEWTDDDILAYDLELVPCIRHYPVSELRDEVIALEAQNCPYYYNSGKDPDTGYPKFFMNWGCVSAEIVNGLAEFYAGNILGIFDRTFVRIYKADGTLKEMLPGPSYALARLTETTPETFDWHDHFEEV